jgi:signal transduction histidine kinase
MAELHPAVAVLLLSGLLIFWLTPISAWWMLARPVDIGARLWFSGTAVYALVATLFVFSKALHPLVTGPLVMSLAMASVLCMVESIRRELSDQAPPLVSYGLGLGLHLAIVLGFFSQDLIPTLGVAVHLVLISGLEWALLIKVNRLRGKSGSKALWLIMLVLLAFMAINLARAIEISLIGKPSVLLEFSLLASISLVVNYISVVFYCYGYWGYVLEKNRRAALQASEQAMTARHGELLALERERLANELLRQRTELMEQLSKVGKLAQSGALSATIAHEINQPLTAIQINIEEALRWSRQSQAPEALARLLHRVEQDNQRAAQIVSRVKKMFTHTGSDYKVQSLDQTIGTVLSMLELRLKQTQIRVITHLAASEPFKLSAEELQHALINLLENAIDSLSQIPVAQRHLQIDSWTDPSGLGLAVTDSGPGIAPALRDSIFDLLSSNKAEGMGIGLWLARFIVERHSGTLKLDESFEQGARFVIYLTTTENNFR